MSHAGKVVLVTGAQQGIGRAMALEFAEAGADVAVNWLDDEAAAEGVAEGVRAAGRRAFLVQADVGRIDAVKAMVAAVEQGLGPVDILVNNAGVFPRVAFLEMAENDWDYVLGVNLKGSCFCAQAVAQAMVAAGRTGSIINLTSGAAYRGSPRGVHYCASKGGIVSMTRQMALELAPHRIRVNAIAPGLTDTAQPRYGMRRRSPRAAARSRSAASRSRRRSRAPQCSSPPTMPASSPASACTSTAAAISADHPPIWRISAAQRSRTGRISSAGAAGRRTVTRATPRFW